MARCVAANTLQSSFSHCCTCGWNRCDVACGCLRSAMTTDKPRGEGQLPAGLSQVSGIRLSWDPKHLSVKPTKARIHHPFNWCSPRTCEKEDALNGSDRQQNQKYECRCRHWRAKSDGVAQPTSDGGAHKSCCRPDRARKTGASRPAFPHAARADLQSRCHRARRPHRGSSALVLANCI